jgi:hypothetical protein
MQGILESRGAHIVGRQAGDHERCVGGNAGDPELGLGLELA